MRSLNARVRAAVNLCIIIAELRWRSQRFPGAPSCQPRTNVPFIFISCFFTCDRRRVGRRTRCCCGRQGVRVEGRGTASPDDLQDPIRDEEIQCSVNARILLEMERSSAQLMPRAAPHTPRCQVRTCSCAVAPTCLMAHEHHSHANA